MRVDQLSRRENGDIFFHTFNTSEPRKAKLLLVNGSKDLTEDWDWYIDLKLIYPKAHIISASSNFSNNENAYRHYLEATAIEADDAQLEAWAINLNHGADVSEVGRKLAENVDRDRLQHLMVYTNGNSSVCRRVKESINEYFEDKTIYTGGLAWSSYSGGKGFIGLDEDIREGNLVAIAFYGEEGKGINPELNKLINFVGRQLLPQQQNGEYPLMRAS
ncbi:MAG: FIST N-terminal domain-containing protein [Bacteroidia bacterium]